MIIKSLSVHLEFNVNISSLHKEKYFVGVIIAWISVLIPVARSVIVQYLSTLQRTLQVVVGSIS